MKIIKDVIIAASVDDIWPWLIDSRNIGKFWEDDSRAMPIIRPLNDTADASKKLSIRTTDISPQISTVLELGEKGKRTNLMVTITGWEKIDPNKARNQMPQISLAWERKLGRIKKAVESDLKHRSRSEQS